MKQRQFFRKITGFLLAFACFIIQLAPIAEARGENIHTITVKTRYCQTEARKVLEQVNSFRTGDEAWYYDVDDYRIWEEELPELEWDYGLEKVAIERAVECAILFSHMRPDGSSCFTAFPSEDSYLGENVARNYDSAESVVEAWKETDEYYEGQGHRRNMLDRDYNYMAAACVTYRGRCYWALELSSDPIDPDETDADDDLHIDSISADISEEMFLENSAGATKFKIKAGEAFSLPRMYGKFRINGSDRYLKVELPVDWTLPDPSFGEISDGEVTVYDPAMTTIHGTFSFFGRDFECDYLLDARQRIRFIRDRD